MKKATLKKTLILNGSISTATAKCGNLNCRCQQNKKFWHGPYYRWTGKLNGKRTTVTLSEAQLKQCMEAMKNYQLLKESEESQIAKTMEIIRNPPED